MMNYGQPYQQFNQFQPQLQRLQQLEQQFQQPPQNKVINVANEDIAKNTQIPLDGTTTYFVYGDSILARNWNVAGGCVDNKFFKLQENSATETIEHVDRLKVIEDKLDELIKKQTYPINKKAVKDAE